jgi:hypothetical protein
MPALRGMVAEIQEPFQMSSGNSKHRTSSNPNQQLTRVDIPATTTPGNPARWKNFFPKDSAAQTLVAHLDYLARRDPQRQRLVHARQVALTKAHPFGKPTETLSLRTVNLLHKAFREAEILTYVGRWKGGRTPCYRMAAVEELTQSVGGSLVLCNPVLVNWFNEKTAPLAVSNCSDVLNTRSVGTAPSTASRTARLEADNCTLDCTSNLEKIAATSGSKGGCEPPSDPSLLSLSESGESHESSEFCESNGKNACAHSRAEKQNQTPPPPPLYSRPPGIRPAGNGEDTCEEPLAAATLDADLYFRFIDKIAVGGVAVYRPAEKAAVIAALQKYGVDDVAAAFNWFRNSRDSCQQRFLGKDFAAKVESLVLKVRAKQEYDKSCKPGQVYDPYGFWSTNDAKKKRHNQSDV